ncbi:hypothetical protein FACS1894181_16760 [Bacteroidia bacterium]|nr:hypothetical protein FACS1894181_16760 [Bacteroidia bacterium]
MKGFYLIIGALLSLLSSCGNDVVWRIEGKIVNLENQTIYAVFESEGVNVMDTIFCDKPGQFRLEQTRGDFQQVTLFFEDRTAWFTVYLEPKIKRIEVKGDIHYPDLLQAKGGHLNNELSSFRKKMEALLKEGTDIRKSINVGTPSERNELISRLANVRHQLDEYALAYIQANPDKPASVVLIKTYFTNPEDTRRLDELLIILAPELKDFYLVNDLEQYSIRAKRTALGAEAPGFTVKNIYGKTVGLDSFSQKYILLTFTAPWCDMCRPDDLCLDEIDKKYSKEHLEQLLISLDDDMKGVRDILKKDSIHWNLVADSAGQATMLVDLYNVSSLPRSFLIDEEGKIILKTENGVEIKQALERLIK